MHLHAKRAAAGCIFFALIQYCIFVSFFSCDIEEAEPPTPTPTNTATPTNTPTATPTPTLPPLTMPEIIDPIDKLKTSSDHPLLIIHDTNFTNQTVTNYLNISESDDFDPLLSQEQLDRDDEILEHYILLNLLPGHLYYYKCVAIAAGYHDTDSEIRSLLIDKIGGNTPNIYLCAGDSITRDSLGSGNPYPAYLTGLLQGYFGSSSATINEGIGGLFTAELEMKLPGFLSNDKPCYTIILIGINDIMWPASCPDPYDCRPMDHIRNIISICYDYSSIPILCTLTPHINAHVDTLQQILDLNEGIRELCMSEAIDMVDLYEAFMNYEGNIADLYFSDGVHPNAPGNTLIAETVFDILQFRAYAYPL